MTPGPNESATLPGADRQRQAFYFRASLGLIGLGTLLHLAYSTHLELVGDEAYYWLWSRHPDICYLDKGPMIAWLIRLGTALFGQTVFGVRFFAVILAAGTGMGLYWLGRELFSARAGFWAVVLASLAPLFAVGAALMTIDTVYVFFWTWAAWTFWRAQADRRLRWWFLTGLLVGLGILSKYTALFELISFLAFCAWYQPSRAHLRQRTFWVMTGTALLFLTPAVIWNVQHHWPTSHWLLQRGGMNARFSLHPSYALSFIGEQAGVLSPFFFAGLVWILSQRSLRQRPQPATGYALALTLPLLGFYFALSFHYHEPPNWTAAAYIGGLILLAAKWIDLAVARPWARWAALAAIVFALIETGILLETRWLHLPHKVDPLDRARGSQSLAAFVAQVQQETGAQFVVADHYMTAALLSFYLPGQPKTYVPITAHPLDQLEIWPTYEDDHPTGAGLFVTKRNQIAKSFRAGFSRIQLLKEVTPVDGERKIGHYKIYICRCRVPSRRSDDFGAAK